MHYSKLKEYFYGELSEKEREAVRSWLEDPENKFCLDRYLRMLWNEMEVTEGSLPYDQQSMLDKIHHLINLRGKRTQQANNYRVGQTGGVKKLPGYLVRAAAILLLPVMIYVAWQVYGEKLWLESQRETVYNEITCPLGARSHFELPDGTTGSLNNGSSLKYPVKFQGNERVVKLKGEAFFDVRSSKRRPFIIETQGLDVKVTGTRLNVYSYPDEKYQEFTVESGTIELLKQDNEGRIELTKIKSGHYAVFKKKNTRRNIKGINKYKPQKVEKRIPQDNLERLESQVSRLKSDERIIYELANGVIEVEYRRDIEKYSSWKDGLLVLRNDPMPILLKRIERWYHVDFNVVDEEILEYTYWATFEQESIDQVLKLLSLSGPIEFKKHPRQKKGGDIYKPQVIDVMFKEQKNH